MNKYVKDYLIYTFLIMIICWGICAVCSLNGIFLNENYILYVPYLLGGWSPTIASFFVLKKNNKVIDFKDWLKNVFDFRHNVFSYLMVIVLGILFILPQCLISGYENGAPLFAIIVMIPVMLLGGGLEEAGWRYILQPELEKKYKFIISTLIVSVIWWLWHLPLFYIQGVFQYGQNYLAFGINVLGLAFALASIRKNTNSIWLCVLFHCIANSLWVRIMNDYGHIDDETPSFAISLLKEYRNYGIGTGLMKQMLMKLKMQGYKQASLAVQKINYAVCMYQKVGFEIVDENDEEYIMICRL